MTKASKVIITNDQSDVKIPSGIRLLIRRCCNATLAYEKFDKLCEISVTFVNNEQIAILNKQYRNKDMSTDVLSFPMYDENGEYEVNTNNGYVILGDIVLSIEMAIRQAKFYGHSIEREVGFLTVHSMLHLLGYDHEKNDIQASIMREKEEDIMRKVGLSRNNIY